MVRVAVCDDEENTRAYLAALIGRQGVECEVAEYANAGEYLSDERSCDILLLDIELGGGAGGMDGLSLARQIRDTDAGTQPLILFVTGHERYVYNAFDVDAFQYLVKPVDERRFSEVFRRAVERHLSGAERRRSVLTVQCAGKSRVVPFRNIYYVESQGHRIVLHLESGDKACGSRLEYYGKLGELESRLQGQFCRIHKGYLINLSCVEEYGRREVTLSNGETLPVSKYRYGDFVKAYLHFIQLEA